VGVGYLHTGACGDAHGKAHTATNVTAAAVIRPARAWSLRGHRTSAAGPIGCSPYPGRQIAICLPRNEMLQERTDRIPGVHNRQSGLTGARHPQYGAPGTNWPARPVHKLIRAPNALKAVSQALDIRRRSYRFAGLLAKRICEPSSGALKQASASISSSMGQMLDSDCRARILSRGRVSRALVLRTSTTSTPA